MRELFKGRYGRIAAGLFVSEFVAATQGLVIAAIMPRVVADLHGLAQYPLAFGSFFAAFFLVLPFSGPWTDRYGLRQTLAVSFALLGSGLALVALAPNMASFLGARAVEGVGDGLAYAATFAAIAKSFPPDLRARMFSLNSMAWALPGIVAPATGAFVATAFGWRWAFAGLLPLLAVAAVLLLPSLENRPTGEGGNAFDVLRALLSRAVFRAQRGTPASLLAFATLHAAFFGADGYVALMLVAVRGISLQLASICLTVAVLGWSAAAYAAPSIARRYGSPVAVCAGAVALVAGEAILCFVAAGAPVWLAFVAWVAAGAGIGTAYPTISSDVFESAHEGKEGVISSATALSAVVGLLTGTVVCGIPVTVADFAHAPLGHALIWSFAIAATFGAGLAAIAPRVKVRDRMPR